MRGDIKESLDRYVRDSTPTGDFLRAVLSNDLMQAMARADDENRRDLFDICDYVYNDMPSGCHGSPEIVKAWLARAASKAGTPPARTG